MDSSTYNGAMGFGRHQPPETPSLCGGGGCCFFGTAENRGLCSKCYTAYLKENMAKSTAAIVREEEQVSPAPSDQSKFGEVSDALESATLISDRSHNPSVRCGLCNKKVRLLGFECRCGVSFCLAHRYPEAHACRFDFNKAGKIAIHKENPVCKADKIVDRV